jgi:hypothetical protein
MLNLDLNPITASRAIMFCWQISFWTINFSPPEATIVSLYRMPSYSKDFPALSYPAPLIYSHCRLQFIPFPKFTNNALISVMADIFYLLPSLLLVVIEICAKTWSFYWLAWHGSLNLFISQIPWSLEFFVYLVACCVFIFLFLIWKVNPGPCAS